jgi:hypothetical protein
MNSQPQPTDTNMKTEPNAKTEPIRKTDPKSGADLDPIDHILSTDGELVPSSGFLASVMDRVREEAAAPPPIPFPWKRFLPGMLLALSVFGWGAFQLSRSLPQALQQLSSAGPHLGVLAARDLTQAGWIALACVLALVSWLFAKRLAGQSNLL